MPDSSSQSSLARLPPWFRQPLPSPEAMALVRRQVRVKALHTVCESARCPNLGRCWSSGVATFMILGDVCTRACRFCAISAGRPQVVDPDEPLRVAEAVAQLGLRYVVITSVARDDLPDEGVEQFAAVIKAIRKRSPHTLVEVLIPDFSAREELLQRLAMERPDVVSHNIETVRRLSPMVRPQAKHDRSLEVLRWFARNNGGWLVKSGLMVGLGETDEEVVALFDELIENGCELLTIGQYLAPTQRRRHLPVEVFKPPEWFERMKTIAEAKGFKHVMSGPLVRSSYLAEEGFRHAQEWFKSRQPV